MPPTNLGSAEWVHPELLATKRAYKTGALWLGRNPLDKLPDAQTAQPIGYSDDRHVLLVSGNRGGKGTSIIMPNLCLWPGSVLVVDPKGENATVTAARRGQGSEPDSEGDGFVQGMGQDVYVLDPFQQARGTEKYRCSFNPLMELIDPVTGEPSLNVTDDADKLADALVVPDKNGTQFFDVSARLLLKGLILHVLSEDHYIGRRNLVTVRQLLMQGDMEGVEFMRAAGETDVPSSYELLWAAVGNNRSFNGVVAGIGQKHVNMLLDNPKLFYEILATVDSHTSFLDSVAMQNTLQESDFRLSDLKTNKNGISLYLCLPQDYMETHARWLRMVVTLAMSAMQRTPGRIGACGHQTLMLLDEFAGLERMKSVEVGVGQIAGYGVKMFFVLQSLEQLKRVYSDGWETFIGNCGVKIVFNLDDYFTREYVSKYIGDTEVLLGTETISETDTTQKGWSKGGSETFNRSHSVNTGQGGGSNNSRGGSLGTNTGRGGQWSNTTGQGTSESQNWSPGLFWGRRIAPGGSTSSQTNSSHTTGENWSAGTSRGVNWQEGTSSNWSKGESDTEGSSTAQNWGESGGSSLATGKSTNQTRHRRRLIAPDELGRLFASIEDQQDPLFPGLALLLISGSGPSVTRRTIYYEDVQFDNLYMPHPDYPIRRRVLPQPPQPKLVPQVSPIRNFKSYPARVDRPLWIQITLIAAAVVAGALLVWGLILAGIYVIHLVQMWLREFTNWAHALYERFLAWLTALIPIVVMWTKRIVKTIVGFVFLCAICWAIGSVAKDKVPSKS